MIRSAKIAFVVTEHCTSVEGRKDGIKKGWKEGRKEGWKDGRKDGKLFWLKVASRFTACVYSFPCAHRNCYLATYPPPHSCRVYSPSYVKGRGGG